MGVEDVRKMERYLASLRQVNRATSRCILPRQLQHFSGTSVALHFHLVMQAGEFRREKEAVEQQTSELNKRLRNLKVRTFQVV